MTSRLPHTPGLSAWRPRSTKAAAPTVEALLKKDDAEGLAKRLERLEGGPLQNRDDFWKHAWPKLMRRCQKINAPACYRMLVAQGELPLPPTTLAWLMEAEERFPRFSDGWDATAGHAFALRLAASAQVLHNADWLRLVRLGGLTTMISYHSAQLETAPWYATAWQAWCGSQKNRDDALDLMVSEEGRTSRYERAIVFKHMFHTMQGVHRERFVHGLALRLQIKAPALLCRLSQDMRAAQTINGWACTARKLDVGLNHPFWASWFAGIGEVIARDKDPKSVHNAYVLLRTVFQMDQEDASAPAGLEWTCEHAQGWASYLANTLLDHPDKVKVGVHPQHNDALTALFHLEHLLDGWGLTHTQASTTFLQTMDALTPTWREVIEVQALGEDHIPPMRRQWRARLLDRQFESRPSAPSPPRF